MGIYNLIRNRDFFGHVVQLNFNRMGPEHQTFGGGLVSLLVNIMMGTYVYILVRRMVKYDDDTL
jgi:hypothetical protein